MIPEATCYPVGYETFELFIELVDVLDPKNIIGHPVHHRKSYVDKSCSSDGNWIGIGLDLKGFKKDGIFFY
jgi:hypothetical protein